MNCQGMLEHIFKPNKSKRKEHFDVSVGRIKEENVLMCSLQQIANLQEDVQHFSCSNAFVIY
jgi:hypothetical protein